MHRSVVDQAALLVQAALDQNTTTNVINLSSNCNKGRFGNNSDIDTLISKRLSVENKAKLSQLTWPDLVTIVKLRH